MKRRKLNGLFNSNYSLNLYTTDDMQNILMQEQARSIRSTQEFSMIMFVIENKIDASAFIDDLCHFLKPRLRSIDKVGWLNDNQITIVMPYTPIENAAKFHEEIQEVMEKQSHIITAKLFAFPSLWPYKQEKDQRNANIL